MPSMIASSFVTKSSRELPSSTTCRARRKCRYLEEGKETRNDREIYNHTQTSPIVPRTFGDLKLECPGRGIAWWLGDGSGRSVVTSFTVPLAPIDTRRWFRGTIRLSHLCVRLWCLIHLWFNLSLNVYAPGWRCWELTG